MKTGYPVIDLCDESDHEEIEPGDARENRSAAARSNDVNRNAKRGHEGNPLPSTNVLATDSPSAPEGDVSTTKLAVNPDAGVRRKRARIVAEAGLGGDLSTEASTSCNDGEEPADSVPDGLRQPLMILRTTSDPTDERVVVTSNLMESLLNPRLLFTRRPVRICRSPTLLHVQQRDLWSCGYRNWQMVLSALLPLLPPNHTYNVDRPRESVGAIDVPTLNQLQHCLELAWAAGMDPKGCQHYRGRIAGTQAKIGAVEVATALNSCGLDATVVQFISIPESRTQLGPFCAAYMGRQSRQSNLPSDSSRELALGLLRDVDSGQFCAPPLSERPDDPEFVEPRPPLYLQYQGHSVTIVGVEFDSHRTDAMVSNLLVFDPRQPGEHLDSALQRGDLAPFRRSLARLHSQDTQVVLCTSAELRSKDMSVVTAREQAVLLRQRR